MCKFHVTQVAAGKQRLVDVLYTLQILNLYSVVMMDEFTMTFDLIKLAIILMTAVPGCSKIRAAA